MSKKRQPFCVIGAGPSGLAAAKNFAEAGIPFDAFEQSDEVGGNWYYGSPHSSVFQSTHMISSKRLTEYSDFRMPRHWPQYPSHAQACEYLRSYAREFGLYERITFGATVERVTPRANGGWDVTVAGEASQPYRGVVIANGHHWDPQWPNVAGAFSGTMLHAHQYKTPDILRDQRVLVIGAGNSGCDVAVEAALNAQTTLLSMRRGYHFLPKFLFGAPIDRCGETLQKWRLPWWLYREIAGWLARVAVGPPERCGLPAPDHQLFESHPIVNSQLPYHAAHGDIQVKPNVTCFDGQRVTFADGTHAEVDLVICATGYKVSVPFIDPALLPWHGAAPSLYLNTFHPDRDDLFMVGLTQPSGGQWKLSDYQAQLISRFVRAQDEYPAAADWFRQLKRQRSSRSNRSHRYLDSPRHDLEVEYFSYRRTLERLIRRFDRRLRR